MWWLEEVMPRSPPLRATIRMRGVAPETHHQVSSLRAGIPMHHAFSDGEEGDNTDLENMYETSWTVVDRPDPRTIPSDTFRTH